MDKNIGGVDLEELMKAREELDRERGVETDPNMYSNYNPHRAQSSETEDSQGLDESNSVQEPELETGSDEENETVLEQNSNENSAAENLSKFGAFSAFDVNTGNNDANLIPSNETESQSSSNEAESQNSSSEAESQTTETEATSSESNKYEEVNELNNLLNDLLSEHGVLDEEAATPANGNFNGASIDIEPKFETEDNTKAIDENQESNEDQKVNNVELEDLSSQETATAENEVEKILDDLAAENSIDEEDFGSIEDDINEPKSQDDADIITDFSQLKEILQNELKESEVAEQEKIAEAEAKGKKVKSKYPSIEDFKFIDEIASEEFKESDKFSYILGKNEQNETVFGNFKEHFNLAIFGKNDIVINSLLNSMILSLSLKNSYRDVNFVLLDSNINSSFEVYNKSSYLYFNRIAKTNKEISDVLVEVSKEIDVRYEKHAELGVKNIEAYNEAAIAGGFSTLPNIIVVLNNYTSASQATDSEKINACLYQILKFGRNVGVYCVVTAKLPIEVNQVNYNLSSRLSFKSDEDSRYTIGEAGAEDLPEENDALYYNISRGKAEHIKAASVSEMEQEIIIKDLED